jgi:TNF receptor-associated factor 4
LNTFKLTNYAKRKSNSDHVFSPPFYSSPGGYKLCIKVHANGIGEGKGTHLSVYAYLMRGDNDNNLPWRFTGTVEIELLNQLEDDWHHSRSVDFRKSDRGKRVKDGDRAITGYGHRKYILQSSLDYDANFEYQYLKNDCLYLRTTVNRCNPHQNHGSPLPMCSELTVLTIYSYI